MKSAYIWLLSAVAATFCFADDHKPVWELSKSYREKTPTNERVCLNGLWRWQPAKNNADAPPDDGWGFFKTPGSWPGITDYMQKDCQTVFAHPSWKNENVSNITAAWYQREITISGDWTGRRIAVSAEYVNSFATVFVDGKKAGEIRFPSGEVDLTSVCKPGEKHVLSLLVVAMPLKAVLLSYTDSASAREVKGSVARRGLCGDVWLVGTPKGARIANVKVDTSTRKGEISCEVALQGLAPDTAYTLRAQIKDGDRVVKEFTSKAVKSDRFVFTEKWKPDKLWDIHTPQNVYHAQLSLLDASGKVLDTALPVRFGFREFWIEGRDFFLNGSRIYLSAVPLDNALVGAAWANYAAAKESLQRLQSFGINFVYTHNYDCEPGAHLSYAEILLAADDVGMLVSFTQPHFANYDWDAPGADEKNGYARHAEFYVRAAQNRPSVVFYSMNHNATGYNEDMNPDMIDGVQGPRDQWSLNNSKRALRAEAIVKRLDPARIVYHHAGGNIGAMFTSNFYPNFAPTQELSDWFETWATKGVKPLFLCEYGAPSTWDWTMYRGWYKGKREFGSAPVPWEFCFAEWNAQFLGDRAFKISDAEKTNLRWETQQFRTGRVWHRWDYPFEVGSRVFADRYEVMARYITDNWRAYRAWGVSGITPWDHSHYWKLRDGMNRNALTPLKTDWENLQRPGFSADYIQDRYETMDLAYERADWVTTPASQAVIRNNRPLLAFIAGKTTHSTGMDHNVRASESIEKQIIVINNSRVPVTCDCAWSFGSATGSKSITVPTGQQARIPVRLIAPATPGASELNLTAKFSTGETQKDSFTINVMPAPQPPKPVEKIAVFDPKGETAAWLKQGQRVEADADLSAFDILVVGKGALSVDGPAPDISRVRDGLKVIMFEQKADVLERRFGFRVAEYGLRQVFKRVPDHPLLAGIGMENLRDWRGEATTAASRLKYELSDRFNGAPTVRWCDIEVTRIWRCGNYGNVASVLIEKPARGDFLPVVDGGFSLQYSPLLEYREGKGMILFCQMDVTGRTENDPAAETILRNIMQYVSAWKSSPTRRAFYTGDPAVKKVLESAGFALASADDAKFSIDDVLVVGPGGGSAKTSGTVLAIGLDQTEVAALPVKVTFKRAEHIAAYFEPFGMRSPFAGIGPADVHNRDPRVLPMVNDGVLTKVDNVIFCQLAPWQFDYRKQFNVKRTYRRTSFLVTRLLSNMGVPSTTPLLARFHDPLRADNPEKRWLSGFYLDTPEDMDDPYRFFRW